MIRAFVPPPTASTDMPPKKNPLQLNALQLRTLALFQELARHPETGAPEADGAVRISYLPHAHGDHLHVGSLVVSARDASGFSNQAVWKALERKGLAKADFPSTIMLTSQGLAYDTGLTGDMVRPSDH